MPFRIIYFGKERSSIPAEFASTMFDARKRAYATCDALNLDRAEIEFIGAADRTVMIEKIQFGRAQSIQR
jgi:hypothetical protein